MEEMTREDAMKDLEATIRDWLDARGLVAVPKEPTEKELRDIAAAARDFMTENGLYPRARAVRKAVLAAAPDPFKEASE